MTFVGLSRPTIEPRTLGAKCDECPLRCVADAGKAVGPRYAQPSRFATGNTPTPQRTALIIIAEAPGRNEEREGVPLIGESGKLLDEMVNRFAFDTSTLHKSNALLCRPDRYLTPKEWRQAIKACQPRLQAELTAVTEASQCRTLYLLGARALQTVCGKAKIFDWVGTPYLDPIKAFAGYSVIATLHPAFVLRESAYRPVLAIHTLRAIQLAEGSLKPWTWPATAIGSGPDVEAMLEDIAQRSLPIGVDVETHGRDPLTAPLLNVGIADAHAMVSVDWTTASDRLKALAISILQSQQPKVYQNGQFDLISLATHGIIANNYAFDTLLAHYLAAPGVKHSLDFIACIEFSLLRWKQEFRLSTDDAGTDRFIAADPTERALYNARDAWVTVLLEPILRRRLKQTHNGEELYATLHQLAIIAISMRTTGIAVDPAKLTAHKFDLQRKLVNCDREIEKLTRELGFDGFNVQAKAHLTHLFFDRFGLKPLARSVKTGQPKIDTKLLSSLIAHPNRQVSALARLILKRRKAKTLMKYVTLTTSNGIVHPTWNPQGARTGRWSSQRPNMQNFPQPRYKVGARGNKLLVQPGMRNVFCARPGHLLITADYSQLELRLIALASGDRKLLAWYADGIDVHTLNARDLFGCDVPLPNQRVLAKNFVYNANYLGSAETIWKLLIVEFPELTLYQVKRLLAAWFAAHPDIRAWHARILDRAARLHYVECELSGRRLHFLDGKIEGTKVANHPIQTGAAWLINRALIAIYQAIRAAVIASLRKSRVLTQVHDELTCETIARRPEAHALLDLMHASMEQTVELAGRKMTFPVEFKIGVNWGESKPCKTLAEARAEIDRLCA